MGGSRLQIVDTGVANIASLTAAFRRLEIEPRLTRDPHSVERADYAVLPGVGAFGAGMEMLREHELVEPLRARIEGAEPTLAVCLGMQLLASRSEESPELDGLGLLDVEVRKFSEAVRTPQFGWNEIAAADDCELLRDGYAYFANSYRIDAEPTGWACGRTQYGGSFVSALERGPVLACQFHPEISGDWGQALLRRWLERGGK